MCLKYCTCKQNISILFYQVSIWLVTTLTFIYPSVQVFAGLMSFIFCTSPDTIRQIKSRRMRWAGHVARMGEKRKLNKVLLRKPEGKRPLGRPRRRWDGIRMDLRDIGWGSGE
jgi:hypothetical protein